MRRSLLPGLLVLAACAGDSSPEAPAIPARVVVTPDSALVYLGDSVQLTATVVDSSDEPVDTATITYFSYDTSRARVSAAGMVTTLRVGNAVVRAASGELSANVHLVVRPVLSLQVTPDSAALPLGGSVQLAAVHDSAGITVGGAAFVYTSSDTTVVRVSATGLVTSVAPGYATITVTSDTLVAAHPVVVLSGGVFVLGDPVGVAVSSTGQAYVTRTHLDRLSRLLLGPDTLATEAVTVGSFPADVAFNPAGTVAYVTNFLGGTVQRVVVGASAPTATTGVGPEAFHVRVLSTGAKIVVTSNNHFLYILNATTLARVDSIGIDGDPNGLALKGDTLAYVSSLASGHTLEVDLVHKTVTRTFLTGATPQEVLLSKDGATLYVANEGGWIDVIPLSTGIVGTPINGVGGAFGMSWTAAGDTLLVGDVGGYLRKVVPATSTVTATYHLRGVPRRIAVHSDGTILVANESGWLNILR